MQFNIFTINRVEHFTVSCSFAFFVCVQFVRGKSFNSKQDSLAFWVFLPPDQCCYRPTATIATATSTMGIQIEWRNLISDMRMKVGMIFIFFMYIFIVALQKRRQRKKMKREIAKENGNVERNEHK